VPNRIVRASLLLAAITAVTVAFPRWYCGRDADEWFDGRASTQRQLADHVADVTKAHKSATFYQTGASRFDGQSAIAIYQMTLLGLGQIVLEHPELRDVYLPAMRHAARQLVDPATLRYASRVYGQHGVKTAHFEGHAYLGYINLGLSMLRLVDPTMDLAPLHDRITAELARQLDASTTGHIETYPGETWPPDVAAVAGSIGLHATATGTDRSEMLNRWAKRFADCALAPSGFLYQRLESGTCRPKDLPRGSGTAIAAYFAHFAAPALAARLQRAIESIGWRSFLGFGAVREYPPGTSGLGDGNSGPVVFGVSVGASGFAIGSARAHANRTLYCELLRTANLFGIPVSVGEHTSFGTGGILGNALLLAMLTARTG
jgi:hypothetical protein